MSEEFYESAKELADRVNEGSFHRQMFDYGNSWNECVTMHLRELGWKVGDPRVGFQKPALINYLVKEGKSVTLLTSYFMGVFTEVTVQTEGKEFTGLGDGW
jgi:hypothetical protein